VRVRGQVLELRCARRRTSSSTTSVVRPTPAASHGPPSGPAGTRLSKTEKCCGGSVSAP